MPDIKLKFINQSGDYNNSTVVIFQKNQATSFDEIAVAWTVINNCGHESYHPFTFPMDMYVSASDSYGNYTELMPTSNGQQYSMIRDNSGDVLRLTGKAASAKEIDVLNQLDTGAINANIYKDGKLLATKTNIVPGQKAVFEFKPTIFIGVVSQVEEGDVMDSAILSNINTELSLLGVISADVVMTGGGRGASSTAFQFSLQNVLYV